MPRSIRPRRNRNHSWYPRGIPAGQRTIVWPRGVRVCQSGWSSGVARPEWRWRWPAWMPASASCCLSKSTRSGGLTSSIDLQADDIPVGVDRFYHVILESDSQVLKLLDRVGMRERVRWASAPASIIANATRYPATNLIDMARLPALALPTRALIGFNEEIGRASCRERV